MAHNRLLALKDRKIDVSEEEAIIKVLTSRSSLHLLKHDPATFEACLHAIGGTYLRMLFSNQLVYQRPGFRIDRFLEPPVFMDLDGNMCYDGGEEGYVYEYSRQAFCVASLIAASLFGFVLVAILIVARS